MNPRGSDCFEPSSACSWTSSTRRLAAAVKRLNLCTTRCGVPTYGILGSSAAGHLGPPQTRTRLSVFWISYCSVTVLASAVPFVPVHPRRLIGRGPRLEGQLVGLLYNFECKIIACYKGCIPPSLLISGLLPYPVASATLQRLRQDEKVTGLGSNAKELHPSPGDLHSRSKCDMNGLSLRLLPDQYKSATILLFAQQYP